MANFHLGKRPWKFSKHRLNLACIRQTIPKSSLAKIDGHTLHLNKWSLSKFKRSSRHLEYHFKGPTAIWPEHFHRMTIAILVLIEVSKELVSGHLYTNMIFIHLLGNLITKKAQIFFSQHHHKVSYCFLQMFNYEYIEGKICDSLLAGLGAYR